MSLIDFFNKKTHVLGEIGYCNFCKVQTYFRTKTRRYLKYPFIDTFFIIVSFGLWIFFTEIKQDSNKQCLVCKKWNTFRILSSKEALNIKKSKIINSYPISKSKY